MITPVLQSNLEAFNATLAKYYTLTSKSLEQVLDKKGRDLAIKLFQGFRARKWTQGAGSISAVLGTMFDKARKLSRSAYRRGERLSSFGKAPVRMPLGGSFAGTVPSTDADGQKLSEWQQAVAQEAIRRRAGRGVLAVSFLWSRARWGSQGVSYVTNKTGTPLGAVEKGEDFLRITGLTDGLSTVDTRYGVVAAALDAATTDMNKYIADEMLKLWGEVFTPFNGTPVA